MLSDIAHRELSNLAINMHAKPGAFALLLGSGISWEAGIPTGWGVTVDLIKRLCKTRYEGEASKTEEELVAWYHEKFGKEPDYSDLIEHLGKTAAGERDLLAGFFEPLLERRDDLEHRRPTRAHKAIANLIASGMVKIVVTTNFDRLLEQALIEAGVTPDVIITDESDIPTSIPRVHANVVIIKVHGDYKRANLRNSVDRLKTYPDDLREYVADVARDYGLVIAGWSGRYDYALRTLLMSPGAYPTYWIEPYGSHKDAEELREVRAATMIKATANEGFDRLHLKLEALMRDTPPPRSAKEASSEVKRLLSEPRRYAIQLEDYLQELSFSLVDALRGDKYIPQVWQEVSRDQEFLDTGLKLAAPAAAALVTVARYDYGGHYENLLPDNFGYLEQYAYDTSASSGAAKVIALRSVPFAVLCVLADQSRYTSLTKLASTLIRYQGFYKSSVPLVKRLVQIGLISYEKLRGANISSIGGFRAMKDAVALLPQGLLRRPTEALYVAEFLTLLTYLREREGHEPKLWLANYMHDSSSIETIRDFLQRTDFDHNEILPRFRDVLAAHDAFAEDAFNRAPIWEIKGFGGDAVLWYDQAHKPADEGA